MGRTFKFCVMIQKLLFFCMLFFLLAINLPAQELQTIKLADHSKDRGLSVMEALSVRASVKEWSGSELKLQDLSDLLWAANGVNRPGEGKRTASSAMNAQDIDVYVLQKEGAYLYNAFKQELEPVKNGDLRGLVGTQEAPVVLILVSDISRFRAGEDSLRLQWAAIDAGIVSQNIALFCAATGLKTRPRAGFDKEKLKKVLNLKDTQYPVLNHPVGYEKR